MLDPTPGRTRLVGRSESPTFRSWSWQESKCSTSKCGSHKGAHAALHWQRRASIVARPVLALPYQRLMNQNPVVAPSVTLSIVPFGTGITVIAPATCQTPAAVGYAQSTLSVSRCEMLQRNASLHTCTAGWWWRAEEGHETSAPESRYRSIQLSSAVGCTDSIGVSTHSCPPSSAWCHVDHGCYGRRLTGGRVRRRGV